MSLPAAKVEVVVLSPEEPAVAIRQVQIPGHPDLPEIALACTPAGCGPSPAEDRQQQAKQDCDDRANDEDLDQGERPGQ